MPRCGKFTVVGLSLAITFFVPLTVKAADHTVNVKSYDVVIAGAGTGGTAAAIQAARMGSTVALLEETDWIGGQMSAAGVSTMDEAYHMTPPSGIYAEFLGRMATYYRARGKMVGTCYSYDASHCYEPSAIRKILTGMIAEVNANTSANKHGHIDIYLQDRVVRVLSDGNTVTGVVTEHGMTLNSKVLIDATEFGDVLSLTPAAYRSGPSVGVDRKNSCIQDITYAMIIKKYTGGVPKELQMLHPPAGYEQWLPMLKREFQVDGNPNNKILPVDFAIHNEYRGLPDSSNPDPYVATENHQITKTGLNWFNDFPVQTSIYNRADRKKLLCDAKLKTLANLYYIQHEMKEPLWSVANDEGYDTAYNRTENSCPSIPMEFKEIEANFPPSPYVRESQRIIGEYTLTGADIRRDGEGEKSVVGFRDAIAVGNYADDLHGCKAPGDFNKDIEHLSNLPPGFIMGPFEVPLRSLIPEKVDGLLAAEKNISQSRLANGATRLQPITMLTGQAAGTLAALAVSKGAQPRSVSPERVQIALLQSGSILAREPMPDIPMGTRPWQAAQFAVTHDWMKTDGKGFAPGKKLTRAEAAETLAYAFSLTTAPGEYDAPKYTKATFKDVPLYVEASGAVETLHAVGIAMSCKQSMDLFCPDGFFTTDQFIQLVVALNARKSPNHVEDTAYLHRDVLGQDDDPVTRGDAAIILYNYQETVLGMN
jgi:hypothetical protein